MKKELDLGLDVHKDCIITGLGIGGQCANLDTFSFSLCCSDCAIDEISESRRHLPVPSLDRSASQQLTHISGTAHLQFLRQPLLHDSGPAPQKMSKICTLIPIPHFKN
jgi:hypothetical protein